MHGPVERKYSMYVFMYLCVFVYIHVCECVSVCIRVCQCVQGQAWLSYWKYSIYTVDILLLECTTFCSGVKP